MGQGGWAGCLGPGADCTEEALHNQLLSEPGLAGLAGRDGGREACSPRGRELSVRTPVAQLEAVHSPASWANLKVFQGEWTKKLDPRAMLL